MTIIGLLFVFTTAAEVLEPSFESDSWTVEKREHRNYQTGVVGKPSSLSAELTHWSFKPEREFLPDPSLTAGAWFKEATLEKIKQPNYSATIRNVSEKTKHEVMDAYGWPHDKPCEIDHLVPCCLGGAQSADNLWPETPDGEWNFHVKDRLEREALKQVREGKLDLRETSASVRDGLDRTLQAAARRCTEGRDDPGGRTVNRLTWTAGATLAAIALAVGLAMKICLEAASKPVWGYYRAPLRESDYAGQLNMDRVLLRVVFVTLVIPMLFVHTTADLLARRANLCAIRLTISCNGSKCTRGE